MAKRHGYSGTRLYRIWNGMKQRCENPNSSNYDRYGGRGITLCDEWHDFLVFREWATTHDYDDALSIDRIDNDGNYCPENCRWLTLSENASRTKYTRTRESYQKAWHGTNEYHREKNDVADFTKRADGLCEIIEATRGLTVYQMQDVIAYIDWIKASQEATRRKIEQDRLANKKRKGV